MNPEDDARQMYVLVQRSMKFSFDKLVVAYLRDRKNKQNKNVMQVKSGKIKLKDLVKDSQTSSIEIKDNDTKLFERYARKFGIAFSIVKDEPKSGELPTFNVFFKARDQEVLELAFKKYSADKIKTATKNKEKEPFTLEKLQEIKGQVKIKANDKTKVKHKSTEKSL